MPSPGEYVAMDRAALNQAIADLDPVVPGRYADSSEVCGDVRRLKEVVKALGEQLEWLTRCSEIRNGPLPPRP